jgi:hypothetical protein
MARVFSRRTALLSAAALGTSGLTLLTACGPVPGGATAIGDSVMLGAHGALARWFGGTIHVDAIVSRQFATVDDTAGELAARGLLRPNVVVAVGTNGTVTAADFDRAMAAMAGATRVVFLTTRVPRSWQDASNAQIRAGVARHGGRAVLADWHAHSARHRDWFARDGFHLTGSGATAYAALVRGRFS